MAPVYIVQVDLDDEFMFFLSEDDAKSKVKQLREENIEKFSKCETWTADYEDRFKYFTVQEGELWWPT